MTQSRTKRGGKAREAAKNDKRDKTAEFTKETGKQSKGLESGRPKDTGRMGA